MMTPRFPGLRNLEEYSCYQQRKLQVEKDCSKMISISQFEVCDVLLNMKAGLLWRPVRSWIYKSGVQERGMNYRPELGSSQHLNSVSSYKVNEIMKRVIVDEKRGFKVLIH